MIRKSISRISLGGARFSILLALLTLITSVALGENISISITGGKLTYQYETQTGSCGSSQQTSADTWEDFSFTPTGGTAISLNGSIDYIYSCGEYDINGGWDYETNSYSTDDWSNELTLTPSVTINGDSCTLIFSASAGSSTGNVSTSCTQPITGYVNPKYEIVGITYAPAGPSSSTWVNYSTSTYVGSTQFLSSSFSSGTTKSVSVQRGFSIFGYGAGSVTSQYSTSNSQESINSSTTTTSINTDSGEITYGTSDYFEPVDNDYDTIWVWLNPVAVFSVNGNSVTWNGYGYETADPYGMDIVPIPLGYLNGDFGPISDYEYYDRLQRSWADNTEVFPTGQIAALDSTDYAAIEAADPFSSSTYGEDFIGYDPPTQTSDGRFTLAGCKDPTSGVVTSSFPYSQADPSDPLPAQTAYCNLTYTSLTTLANSQTSMTSQTFATDIGLSASFLSQFTAQLKTSNTLTWTTMAQQSITNSTTLNDSFQDQGPPCNNTVIDEAPCVPIYGQSADQPTQFDVYQDNKYGTFVFVPVAYY